jgi:pimeloyl-ACP methyl ester carboxylesterase
VPKAPLDFRALIEEPTPHVAYRDLHAPVLIMRGEHAPRPTRRIAEMLPSMLPKARLTVIEGAGHMGPLTHAEEVGQLIAAHVGIAEAAIHRLRTCRSRVRIARTYMLSHAESVS